MITDSSKEIVEELSPMKRKSSFAERFKGRSSIMNKDGDNGIVALTGRPIEKLDTTNTSLFSHLHTGSNLGMNSTSDSGMTPLYNLRNLRGSSVQPQSERNGFSNGLHGNQPHLNLDGGNKVVLLRSNQKNFVLPSI